jgi:hypothetical protein
MPRRTKAQEAERQAAIDRLREWLKPGDTVYTVLRHVSRSGMMRHIDVYKLTDDGPQWLSYPVSLALDLRTNDRDGSLKVGGCGMDMGFHVVYSLSAMLYPDGFDCIGEGDGYKSRCPSNDHVNSGPDRNNYAPTHHHQSGGYALRHRWL